MTVGEIRQEALQIIDAYSENGYIIAEKQPEKVDYVLRVSGFINQAMLRVVSVYPILKPMVFDTLEQQMGQDGVHYTLPEDFLEVGIIRPVSGAVWGIGEYAIIGGELIAPVGGCPVCYYKALPKRLGESVTDEQEIGIAEAGARLVPLYVAAMLISEENPALSTRLLNQFEAMLAQPLCNPLITP